jgi:hypothetical protein
MTRYDRGNKLAVMSMTSSVANVALLTENYRKLI